jgi:phage tail sheath protein FI
MGGIVVAEGPGADSAIAALPTAVTAFVGRTLRGPVNQPVTLCSFAEFHQVFGGLWQPSPLSYAVEQFFEHGGERAVVVRVVNGGAAATITLPCGPHSLTLAARSPGSREVLRASVDYDNITASEPDRFNLVVQRLRTRGSEHIEDQEIFRRVSVASDTTRFVATALQESQLVRVRGPVPVTRPDRTFRVGSRHPIGYVDSNPDGDDGAPLTDYDVIGSPEAGSGLFALAAAEDVRFVCIPPLERDRDVGPSALLVAARLCRERHALLVVDPPAAWQSCDEALQGLREFEFRSEHAFMCFPRIQAFDRLRSRAETFANCGAVAGTLARLDTQRSPWQPGDDDELLLRQSARPQFALTEAERTRLAAHGLNPLQSLRSASPRTVALKTLAGGAAATPAGRLLTAQRRNLLLMASIARGTGWAVFERSERPVWNQLARQVQSFLQTLTAAGLFGPPEEAGAFEVTCDERVNGGEDVAAGRINLLVSVRTAQPGPWRSFMVTHSRSGSSVRPARAFQLPPETRMTVREVPVPAPDLEDTQRQQTLAQALFGHCSEPRPQPSIVATDRGAPAAPAGRLDAETIARIHRDFGRTLQRF